MAGMTLAELPIDDEMRTRLLALSKKLRRTPEELVADWVRQRVMGTEDFLAGIEAGVSDADGGRFVDEAEVWGRVDDVLRKSR